MQQSNSLRVNTPVLLRNPTCTGRYLDTGDFKPHLKLVSDGLNLAWAQTTNGRLAIDRHSKSSDSVSNPLDRTILKYLFEQADAVICGAQTLRDEPNHPMKLSSKLVILTASGDLSHIRLDSQFTQSSTLVFTNDKAVNNVLRTSLISASSIVSKANGWKLAEVYRYLKDSNYKHILLEGGASLFNEAFASQIVASAYLSAAPQLGSSDSPIAPSPIDPRIFKLIFQAIDAHGTTYAYYKREYHR